MIRRAALACQASVSTDTDVTTGASGLIGKSGGAVMTGTAVIALVHGLMIEVVILLGGAGLHEKEIVVTGLALHPHVLTMIVMSEEDGFQGFGPDNRLLRRERARWPGDR